MNLSTYARNELRKHFFRTGSFVKPSALYYSLHAGDPGGTGANEITTTGTGYARAQRDPGDANYTAEATAGSTQLAAELAFPTPSGNWNRTGGGNPAEQITHVGLWDAATGGNFLIGIALTTPKTVNNGDPAPKFPAGSFTFDFA